MPRTNEPSDISSTPHAVIKSLRPRQHVKNALVFAGLIFGARLNQPDAVLRSLALFGAFCLTAGGLYVINDVTDLRHDRMRPRVKSRPVAAGQLAAGTALLWGAVCAAAGIVVAFLAGPGGGWMVAAYAAVSLLYSLWLKNVPVLEVVVVVSGYVLRAAAGAAVIPVAVSPWLLVCTGLLALFMILGKRRAQLSEAPARPAFRFYTRRLLDGAMLVSAAATLAAYSAYTVHPATVARFGTRLLVLTVPFVAAGLLRYVRLARGGAQGAAPAELVTGDWMLLLDLGAWAAAICLIIYA